MVATLRSAVFRLAWLLVGTGAWAQSPPPEAPPAPSEWARKVAAAENGEVQAQMDLGWAYLLGRGVSRDDAAAFAWFRKAAEQGQPKAQALLGGLYAEGRGVARDDAEAVRWYRKAAEAGDAYAQFGLARMYGKGQGVPRDDAEAMKWLRRSADQGNPQARKVLDGFESRRRAAGGKPPAPHDGSTGSSQPAAPGDEPPK